MTRSDDDKRRIQTMRDRFELAILDWDGTKLAHVANIAGRASRDERSGHQHAERAILERADALRSYLNKSGLLMLRGVLDEPFQEGIVEEKVRDYVVVLCQLLAEYQFDTGETFD